MAESIETDIVSFLDKSNLIIKDMHLGNLFMAMMMVKIYKEKAVFSSAGMPPPLIFRQNSKEVEEIRLPALPLGGSADFKYKKIETILSPGDTLLLMSDGFPELFNEQKEILDYKKSKKIFGSLAELSSQQIIDRLCEEADNWRGSAKLEDDLTFVVVKVI
jgi:sigma-B regulation protein RsbU (phosphoserine phosphatase)